jgi:inhibitor of cysteine peptidase
MTRARYLRHARYAAVAMVLLLAGGCGSVLPSGGSGEEQPMSTVTLTLADSGKTVEVPRGGEVLLRLDENPTTGYRWAVDKLDTDVVTIQNDEYSTSGGGAGAGGTRVLTLRATRAGTTSIQLKLWREWEGDSSITQRFAATIRVI